MFPFTFVPVTHDRTVHLRIRLDDYQTRLKTGGFNFEPHHLKVCRTNWVNVLVVSALRNSESLTVEALSVLEFLKVPEFTSLSHTSVLQVFDIVAAEGSLCRCDLLWLAC